MWKYDNKTLQPISLTLAPGGKEHIVLDQGETTVHTNNYPHQVWLKGDQQLLKKKENGQEIHMSN
jgi:hypothetical protein